MANPISAKEIRIYIEDGMVQTIGVGQQVPKNLLVTISDGDTDGVPDHELCDDGYGSRCLIWTWETERCSCPDEDGIRWISGVSVGKRVSR